MIEIYLIGVMVLLFVLSAIETKITNEKIWMILVSSLIWFITIPLAIHYVIKILNGEDMSEFDDDDDEE